MMNRTVAMILAGGQGERLSVLSRQRAKPAVPFGGKYRIIDFTLSNCVNSGIFDVAVLTQYRPHSLNDHIGIGRPWDLDRPTGGVAPAPALPGPRALRLVSRHGRRDLSQPLLSSMSRSADRRPDPLRRPHLRDGLPPDDRLPSGQSDADVTVAVQRGAAGSEASRFGVLEVDADDRIVDFAEKPREPRSNLASMGIYVFNAEALRREPRREESDSATARLRHRGHPLPDRATAASTPTAFNGYWRDVGTIQSYWDANMELLPTCRASTSYDPDWRIHTRSEERPPAKVMDGSHVRAQPDLARLHRHPRHGRALGPLAGRDRPRGRGRARLDHHDRHRDRRGQRSSIAASSTRTSSSAPAARLGVGDDLTRRTGSEPNRLNTGITIVGKQRPHAGRRPDRPQLPDRRRRPGRPLPRARHPERRTLVDSTVTAMV